MSRINTVLVSVTDKTGLAGFLKALFAANPSLKVIASGGTAQALADAGIPYTPLGDYTGFPECFGGRVKTLHPHVAGGILMRRGKGEQEAKQLGIELIDLVVCNLYNFAGAAQKQTAPMEELVEQMDIGGSTLIRASCKNYIHVGIIVDPGDYSVIAEEIVNEGSLSIESKQQLAIKAINYSADYEALLAREFTKRLSNIETARLSMTQGQTLRYGENPDQKAHLYRFDGHGGIAHAAILSGKELSFNNYEDATVAYEAAQELVHMGITYGTAIIKHGNVCGYASGPTIVDAFTMAWNGDRKSAFGSVIAFTSPIGKDLVPLLKDKFIEVMIAPEFTEEFIVWSKQHRPNLRLLQQPKAASPGLHYKNISGGMLVQTRKEPLTPERFAALFRTVTEKQPAKEKLPLYAFAFAAVRFAKSNAVSIAREWAPGHYQLLGIGAGQPNRIDSLQRLALPKAIENLQAEHEGDPTYHPQQDLSNCVLGSDGFFPFDDSIVYAASMGIKQCIQPGGSVKDEEVVGAANANGMSMIFTGERYFSH